MFRVAKNSGMKWECDGRKFMLINIYRSFLIVHILLCFTIKCPPQTHAFWSPLDSNIFFGVVEL